jgi:hypothetical protein
MRKRWIIYIIIGLVFGILDWYFIDLLATLNQTQRLNNFFLARSEGVRQLYVMMVIVLNWGIWLIPAIPVAIIEMKHSGKVWKAALAAVLVWSMALLSYYVYYAFLLMFVGLPNFDFMLFKNRGTTTYWTDWWPPFKRVIVNQFFEWLLVGLVGGTIVGIISAYLYAITSKKRKGLSAKA